MDGINMQILGGLPVVVPPVEEQGDILQYVQSRTHEHDSLIAEAKQAIDLLAERRTALISAAVTGQIDVRACADQTAA